MFKDLRLTKYCQGWILILCATLFSWKALAEAQSEPAVSTADKVLTVGISNRPVFQFQVSANEYTGLDVKLGTAIAEEAGYKVEMLVYPWARINLMIKSGTLDMTFSAAKNADRMEFARFTSEYIRHGHNKLFVLSENQDNFRNLRSLSDIKDLPILVGVQRGYQYSHDFTRLSKETWFFEKLQMYNDSTAKIESLLKGRVDAMIGSEYGTANLLSTLKLGDKITSVMYLDPNDISVRTYMMFSKLLVSQEVVDDFDNAIKRLRRSGELQRIKQRYLTPQFY